MGDRLFIATDTALAVNAVRLNGTSVQISLDGVSWTTVGSLDVTFNGEGTAFIVHLTAEANENNLGKVIDALRYRSVSDNPTQNGGFLNRTYGLFVSDGKNDGMAGGLSALDSNLVSGTISFVTVNDTGLADLNGAGAGENHAVVWNEVADGIHLAVTTMPDAVLTDPDNSNLTKVRFTLAGLLDGNSEVLQVGGADFLLGTSYSNVDVGAFLVSYDHSSGLLTILPDGTTVASVSSYQSLLRGITYNNTTDHPTVGARVFTLVLSDAGPADNGGSPVDSPSSTFTVTVVPANDSPINTVPGSVTVFENATFSFTGIHTVSANDPELNLARVQLTVAQGVLSVNLSGGASLVAGANGSATLTLSGSAAQINAALASLTYAGILDFTGLDSLTIVSTDGDPIAAVATDVIGIAVVSVNKAPEGADRSIVVGMNQPYSLRSGNFGFTDPNNSPSNALKGVWITTLPEAGKGVLSLNGSPVTAGSFVAVAELDAGLLVYTPPLDESGSDYTGFTFQVEDDGGTENGGVNLDATPNRVTVHLGGVLSQSICFITPLEAPVGQVLPLYGNATSGLNMVYTVVSGPGTVDGNLLTFTGAGDVVVRASQPGDLTYLPAVAVDQTVKAVDLAIPVSVSVGWNLAYGVGVASKGQAVAMELSGQVAQHIAVTGYVTAPSGKRDLYVTKRVAATGAEVWSQTYDGTAGLDDEGAAVKFDSAGNVVVIGQETNASGNTDIVVLKFAAANGTQLWKQTFRGSDGTTDTGVDSVGSYDTVNRVLKGRKNLAIGPSDEVIVGGFVTNATAGRDLVVIKYDSNGTKVWHNTYDGAGGMDFANAVAVDGVGNVYAAGGSRTGAAMTTLDGVTLKYDVDGNLVWTARYDNGRADEMTSLMLDRDGNPVVSGYTQQNTFDMFVVRYNQNVDPGAALQTTILWESKFDNPNTGSSEAVWDMGMVFGRDVMLAGTSYPNNGIFNAYTMRFKGTCVEGARWDREFDGAARGQDQMVAMGADYFGSPVVVGYSQVAGGKFAIETIKYDAEPGGMLWSKRYESADGDSEPTAVAVDPSGNVFVVGYTTAAGGATRVLVQNYSPHSNSSRAAQTITFPNPGAQFAGTTCLLGATTNSGLDVQYVVVSGPATILGNSLALQGSGSVTVRASQAGSGDYLPATPVEVTFSVSKSPQTIYFNLPAKIYRVNGQWESFPLSGTATSGLPIMYEIISGNGDIEDGILTFRGARPVTVRASQAGDSCFDPAVSVERTVLAEIKGNLTIMNGFHINWRDRCRLDLADVSSLATGEVVTVALGLTDNDATAGYVAGYVNGVNGRDLYLAKYSHDLVTSTAVQSWVRRINGTANSDDEATAVAVDANGDVVVAGFVTTIAGGRDVFVGKFSSSGLPLWEYYYNGTANGTDMGLTLALEGTSFVIVGGRVEGAGTGNDFFAAKLDSSNGVAVWETEHNRGSTVSDIPARVAVGSDGGVVLTGISGAGNSADAWTIKLNGADGSLQWNRVYNFANRPDGMRGVALDGANNVIVSGYSQGANFDMYTAKYEADTGTTLWDKRYNGSFDSSDAAWDVIVDRQGNVLATGTAYRAAGVKDGMTIKYNGLDGTVAWARRPFNNLGTTTANDENFSIALDGLGNLVVVGYTESPTTGLDYYVARHRNQRGGADGVPIGESVFDGYYEGDDQIHQVRMDPNGAVWMVGYTTTNTGERRPLVVRLAPGP